ncbi:hypothetical protein [Methylobacterium trifolii]|uniref:Uncharacterized protein n=1 Tax=Methylobacterium trifolii TaxID=1003092 RepID=A0ABQ4U440_9HYPH|nr:hypothetical protein [Methylobacterium trifolii]GJE62248.1 hypothetical protein MPOCJGCO_4379 [Methylobacterium trifolii]
MDDAPTTTLGRIAKTLGLPEGAVFGPYPAPDRGATVTADEALELLRLFSGIADPQVRRACTAHVQTIAGEGACADGG